MSVAAEQGRHHTLDCQFQQQGLSIRAFCGAIAKDENGKWHSGTQVFDNTAASIQRVGAAKIIGQPLGEEGCAAYKKKHPTYTFDC